jgi:hypothetical protein
MHTPGSCSIPMLAAVALVLTACSGGGPGSAVSRNGASIPAPAACFNAEEIALMDQVNATWTAAGKPALPFDTRLIQAARQDAQQFAATGVQNFEFGAKYGYGGTSFVGDADSGFASAADFWAQAQKSAGTALTDPLTRDAPFAPRHLGVGALISSDGSNTYAVVLGADPGSAMTTGSCDPTP